MKLDIIITGNDEDVVGIKSSKPYGPHRTISYFAQLGGLLNSLDLNWKSNGSYSIYFLHSLPLTGRYRDLLNRYGVNIVQHPCTSSTLFGLQKEQRIIVYKMGGFGGTHSLIMDYDVLCLRPPNLDFTQDMQVMYSGATFDNLWNNLFLKCGLDVIKLGFNIKKCNLFAEYHNNKGNNLFPFFNHGIVFVNNDFAKTIWQEIERFTQILDQFHDRNIFQLQVASSVAMVLNSNNWSVMPKGCNFLSGVLHTREWNGKISLYHYLGSTRQSLEINKYSDYFQEWMK